MSIFASAYGLRQILFVKFIEKTDMVRIAKL